ncbi:MAG: adenosylcobinamide-GDP ribazoletransferase [Syntrophales bacterium]|nr:adenosylcobinamide-GDP ribazoletransferase [Syntrophales bacterium]
MTIKSFLATIQFLTVLPLPRYLRQEPQMLAGSQVHFPMVGMIIGIIVATIDTCLQNTLPIQTRSVMVVILFAVITGGLHLDGLADTADGLFSLRNNREKVLEIMRDSRLGAMGAITLVLILGLKMASLSEVPANLRQAIIILAPTAGRTAITCTLTFMPYARSEESIVLTFLKRRSPWHALWGIGFLLALSVLQFKAHGVIICVISLCVALMFAIWIKAKLGGFTGDTLGALSEVSETAVIVMGTLLSGNPSLNLLPFSYFCLDNPALIVLWS